MTLQNRTARRQPGGVWTAARAASQSVPYSTTSATARQAPAWIVSKAGADRAWPGIVTLLQRLGFGTPSATGWVVDARQCTDFTTPDGKHWGWRDRQAQYFAFHDTTWRVARPSGAPTEADKLGMIDRALWTWTTSGRIVEYIVLDAARVVPLLREPWPVLTMPDAVAVCVPWQALSTAGAVVDASNGVKVVLERG